MSCWAGFILFEGFEKTDGPNGVKGNLSGVGLRFLIKWGF